MFAFYVCILCMHSMYVFYVFYDVFGYYIPETRKIEAEKLCFFNGWLETMPKDAP